MKKSAKKKKSGNTVVAKWYTTKQLSSWKEIHDYFMKSRFWSQGIRWIFRGQADAVWTLKSSLERVAHDRFGLPLTHLPTIEYVLDRHFRRNLHRFGVRVPPREELLEWFSLMQHHGAPTRLLDWTYSFYIALFFAVDDAKPGTSCAVWGIDQGWLFDIIRGKRASQIRRAISIDRKMKDPKAVNCLFKSGLDLVVPLVPYHMNERLATQQGVFLAAMNINHSFMRNLRAMAKPDVLRKHIVKIEICVTRDNQWPMLEALHRLNINHLSLFPGVDGYARSLQTMVAWLTKTKFSR